MSKSTGETIGKIIAGTGLAAALTAGVTAAVAELFTQIAIDREEPELLKKIMNSITGGSADTTEEDQQLLDEMRRELADNIVERIEISARDGSILVGHWCPVEKPKRILIAMHGWRSNWNSDFAPISDFWRENDCSVLYAEQRGQGESGGDYISFGLLERYDCLDWIYYIAENKGDSLPVYPVGISMGASTVLMASGFELPENVHGIIADCGFTSPGAIWEHVCKNNLHLSYALYEKPVEALFSNRIKEGADSYSTLTAMQTNTKPILFIHGTEDSFVPIEMTYENYKACHAPKRLFVGVGAEHAVSYFADTEGYQRAMRDFWQDFD